MTHIIAVAKSLGLLFVPLLLLSASNVVGQDIGCPQVLCYSRAAPYLNAARHFPWKLKMAFGWQNDPDKYLPTYLFDDSTKVQAFEFPDKLVALCFAEGLYAGAVIFRRNTDSVVAVYPWSEQVKGHLKEGYESNFSFYQTGYAFEQYDTGNSWRLLVFTLVIVDTEYQVWHFDVSMNLGGSGAGRDLILTEKPYIPKGNGK